MLKLLAFLVLTLALTSINAQLKNTNEIVAEGGAKTKVKPDVALFTLTIEKIDIVEKNAIKLLNIEVEELEKSLSKIGFSKKAIKVSDYEIASSIDNQNKKKYTASNTLKVEFNLDNKLIDAFYNEIQEASIQDLDVSFDSKVSDSLEKATRFRLVQLAVEDAKANANNISKALDMKIVGIKQIQKNADGLFDGNKVEMVKFTPPKVIGDTEVKYKTAFDKFQVEDVEMEEKITIVFEISK